VTVSVLDALAEANREYAGTHPGGLSAPPRLRLAVVTCMDARFDVLPALGLELGDAHVLRNAGGAITDDVLRSLALSQTALGTTAVALISHTQCGMKGFDDAAFRAELTASSGTPPPWDVPGFDDAEEAARAAVIAVQNCPWLPHRDDVRGFVFDVDSGLLQQVDPS
jgi:carbonic anhydrase